jgi:NADH/NAD ratio-sensing transcriptional regulator Rex
LDSSISQTEQEFKKQLKFVNSFIDVIVIGADNLRIAVITYSFEVKIKFGDYMDKELLKHAVDAIEYNPGATFTHKG